MIFRLAAGGGLSGRPEVIRRIDELTGQIKAYLSTEGKEKDIQIEWLVNPSYTGAGWKEKALADHVRLHLFRLNGEADWSGDCSSTIRADSMFCGLAADWFCANADMILLVWNEEAAEQNGAVWELMQQAYREKVPCIWISSKDNHIHWLQNGYYGEYHPEYLKKLCQTLLVSETDAASEIDKKIPFLSLGDRLQQRFLRKYKASVTVQNPEGDRLLLDTYELPSGNGAETRKKLLEEFWRYDKKAIELGGSYRAIMYWRAILPMIASLFLAVGFYAETLLGIIPLPWNFKPLPWAVLAGFGFLFHGLLNLYVYLLSRDKLVKGWHRGYIDNRNFAELYRVLVHFLPYGMSLNLRRLCGGRPEMYASVRRVVEELRPASFELNSSGTREMLGHVAEMLEDQLAYHRSSADRYSRVTDALERWNRRVFKIGFVVVILRSLLQFFVAYSPLPGEINGTSVNSYVRSFANMLALLLPAWASYFTSKLNQCNYRYHAGNHREMEQSISAQLERVRRLQAAEDSVPLEVLNTLAEEIAELMLVKDTEEWYGKVASSTVTSL